MTRTGRLLRWYDAGHRDLPWRCTRDPYRIWISEIMLQQTRAEAVIPYYERFLERFPDLAALAAASEEAVLGLWSGLGYYSRARNLYRAARRMNGAFPADYEAIRRLPGVGDYTAAAVASMAFGLPHAVLDGNVMRVIARLTGDAADISSARTRARFGEAANQMLDRRRPGAFNQALMELGATICLPRTPRCADCPLAMMCEARRHGLQQQLPVKLRKVEPVKLEQTLMVVVQRGHLLLWQRAADSPKLAQFWELPAAAELPSAIQARQVGTFRHTITHHQYRVTVETGRLPARAALPAPLRWMPLAAMPTLLLSTTTRKALRCAGIPPDQGAGQRVRRGGRASGSSSQTVRSG